jgi:hypothetical protein
VSRIVRGILIHSLYVFSVWITRTATTSQLGRSWAESRQSPLSYLLGKGSVLSEDGLECVSGILVTRYFISVRIYTGGDVIALEWREHWSCGRMIGNGRIHPHRVDSGASRQIKSEDTVTYPRKHRRTVMV